MVNKNNKNLIIGALVVLVVLLLLGTVGFGSYGMMGYNPGFMLLNFVFSILVIVIIILGVYWLIKHINFNEVLK